jgi:hypothetical protein
MSEIKVKTEYFPQRCEICHQSDLFDESNNLCSRCNHFAQSEIDLNGAQGIEVKVTIDRNDLIKTQVWYFYTYKQLNLINIFITCIVFFMFGVVYLVKGGLPLIIYFLLLYFLWAVLYRPYLIIKSYYKFRKVEDYLKCPIYIFENDCLKINTEKLQICLKWELIGKVVETKNFLNIFSSKQNFIFINKRFFQNQEEFKSVKEILKRNLKSKFEDET